MSDKEQAELEDIMMKMDDVALCAAATKLNIEGCPPGTRKFKALSKIVDYVSEQIQQAQPDETDSLFEQVYKVLDDVAKSQGEKPKSKMADSAQAGFGGSGGEAGPFAALLQNLAAQPASTSLYRRMFKLNGTIGGKDGLSYISICSQVHDAKTTGYSDSEVVIGMKKAVSSGSTLRNYFDSQSNLPLQKLMVFLRDFFKQKSATVLFSDLSKITQNSEESATAFLLRAFELRQQVTAATRVEDHKFDASLIYATFCRSVRTGLRDDNIRAHMKKFLDPAKGPVGDEVLLREINEASSEKEETELKEAELKQKKTKAVVNAVSFDEDALTKAMKPIMDNMASLTKKVEELQLRPAPQPSYSGQSSYSGQYSGQYRRPNNRSPPRCKACVADKVDRCIHCLKCGSSSHFSRNCHGQTSGNE